MERDLERLARMGANAILFHNDDRKSEGQEKTGQDNAGQKNGVRQNPGTDHFYRLCLKRGFLVKDLWITDEKIPIYRGLPGETTQEMLLSEDGRTLTEHYYYYQAKWSREPVLYPALSTLHRQENGLLSLTVYSNQKKVGSMWTGYFSCFSRRRPEGRSLFLRIFRQRSCRCIWRWKPVT